MAKTLTIALTLVIGITTLMPSGGGAAPVIGLDKLAHLVAFAALVVPMTLRHPQRWPLIWCAAVFYGGLIEIVQPYFGRGAEWGDLLADGLGAGIGIAFALIVHRRARSG